MLIPNLSSPTRLRETLFGHPVDFYLSKQLSVTKEAAWMSFASDMAQNFFFLLWLELDNFLESEPWTDAANYANL